MIVAVRLLRQVQITCDGCYGCGRECTLTIAADSDASAYVRMREHMSRLGWLVSAGRDYCAPCARLVLDREETRP